MIPKEVPKIVMPAAAPAPSRPRTKAGDPLTIGDLEVRVLKAQRGMFDPAQTEQRVAIILRVTNRSKQKTKFFPWSDPTNKPVLRTQTTAIPFQLVAPKAQTERTINPGESVEDILVFPHTPPLYGLELDLPIPRSTDKFPFEIPREFIEQVQ